ncbi:hypothetical protein [Cohnella algarum]|uniref:hypothetical protein n=1 Tax=Cohnella algarum TaxID=2044859 RepID=UPI0019677044|nr:hypothetical protein [Cohnella algarum]MBN2983013.1 hypothetical protein [Cohnella algarum]
MNAFNELTNRIKETEEIIDVCKANHKAIGLPDFISELEISSLEQRLIDLQQLQINEEKQSEELEVKVKTTGLPSGQIPVRTLTTVLGGLQSLTDSVANTLFNQPSNRGPIPQEIIERNSWILKAVKAGSFIAVIDLNHESQMSIDEAPQRQIISELYSLFNASDDEEPLLEAISSLGTRTLKYYMDWTKSIRDLNVPVEINWVSTQAQNEGIKASFDPDKAGKIFTILNERLTSREEEVFLQGRLTGINVRTNSFELCTADGNKIVGRIVKDKVSKSVGYVDKRCRAELIKVITQSSAGKEKISWTLNDVQDAE